MGFINKAFDKSSDFISGKITGKNVKTTRVGLNEMAYMINKYFIAEASLDEKGKVFKTVKGGWFLPKMLKSKDGKYQLIVDRHRKVSIFNLNDANIVSIREEVFDENEPENVVEIKLYTYSAFFYGNFKRAVKTYCQPGFGTSLNNNSTSALRCPSCDAELDSDTAFCPKCGAKIEKTVGINSLSVPQNSSKKKIIIGAVAVCIICLIGFVVFSGNDNQTNEDISYNSEENSYAAAIVESVKNGENTYYPGITYGEAFDDFFGSPHWEYFVGSTDDSGELLDIVEFTGTCSSNGVEGDVVIQFTLYDDDTFEMTYFSFDDEAQSLYEMNNLLDTVFTQALGSQSENTSDNTNTSEDYKKAYDDYINSEQIYDGYSSSKRYYLYDMDYDGIPELIVQEAVIRPDYDQNVSHIFTYKDGVMTKVYEQEKSVVAYMVNGELLFDFLPSSGSIMVSLYRLNLVGTGIVSVDTILEDYFSETDGPLPYEIEGVGFYEETDLTPIYNY